jgi:ubiquitin carboxyl-terminal hydrolase 14
MSLAIKIKHAGKTYELTVDTTAPGSTFKQQVFELTGVEPSKVKIVVKGGMLKVRRGLHSPLGSWYGTQSRG